MTFAIGRDAIERLILERANERYIGSLESEFLISGSSVLIYVDEVRRSYQRNVMISERNQRLPIYSVGRTG